MITKGPKIRSTEKSKEFEVKDIELFDSVRKRFGPIMNDNNVSYYKLGALMGGPFYRYMDLETALICLENKSLRFSEPSLWQDNYESRFYNANYKNVLIGL